MKLSWDWLLGAERKKLIRLQVKEQELKVQILEKELNTPGEEKKAYKSVRLIGENVIVVLNDGLVLSDMIGGRALYDKVKFCAVEEEIIDLFIPKAEIKVNVSELVETEEERLLVRKEWKALVGHTDFEMRGEDIYLKGVSMPLPAIIVAGFIEIVEKINHQSQLFGNFHTEDHEVEKMQELEQQYVSLKMFTLKLALNPIQSSREDALRFVRQHDIKLTNLGNLVMYRAIVSVGKKDKKLTKFVSKNYLKVKKWKKSPKNYSVYKCTNNEEEQAEYVLGTSIGDPKVQNYNLQEEVGNLAELYSNLATLEENRYTDAYTNKMDIRVGSVYSIAEEKVDIQSRNDCSSGLHVGTKDFGFSGNGDTMVLCLVNPAKIRSIPYSDANKMRVSEMFVAAVIKDKDMHEEGDILHFDEEYHAMTVEELQEALKNKDFDEIKKCQEEEIPISNEEVVSIVDLLAARVVKI